MMNLDSSDLNDDDLRLLIQNEISLLDVNEFSEWHMCLDLVSWKIFAFEAENLR
jgi:hypothetical protein